MKKLLLFILMVFLLFPANAYCEEDETATDETTVEDAASEPIAEDAPISEYVRLYVHRCGPWRIWR